MLTPLPAFRRRLLAWFDAHRRDLPWRRTPGVTTGPLPGGPYAVLVSEAMLQQTQVATVIPYFHRWMARFPTVEALASADEQEVLRLWQGLGYYSRARNLHKAARAIVSEHEGRVPDTLEGLRSLPGVGPYTAGAVASIAFDRAVPLVDGNVQRVLSRLYAISDDPRTPKAAARLWQLAGELVPASRPGDFNSALMELGATVCTPRNPQCLLCPVAGSCAAREQGLQQMIPPAKKAKPTPHFRRSVYCLRKPDGTLLLEQRPAKGRWAGMWQFPTFDPDQPLPEGLPTRTTPLGEVEHALTHRRYTFIARLADVRAAYILPRPTDHRWLTTDEIDRLPLPKPQLEILRLARADTPGDTPG